MALQHAKPAQIVNLSPSASGRSTALVKTEDFEAIRLVVPSGAEIPAHRVPGRITLQCLGGHVEIGLAGQTVAMKAGDWLYLEGDAPHSVRGLADSAILLTILLRPDAVSKPAHRPAEGAAERAAHRGHFHDYAQCGCVDRWEAEGGTVVGGD